MDAQLVETWVSILQNLVTSAAVVVGGIWGYLRFFRDRTYYPRLELGLNSARQTVGDRDVLVLRVTLKNVGLSPVYVRRRGTGIAVSVFQHITADRARRARWDKQLFLDVFEGHAWIEAKETISDEVAAIVPTGRPVRAEVIIVRAPSPSSRFGRRLRALATWRERSLPETWRTSTIALESTPPAKPPKAVASGEATAGEEVELVPAGSVDVTEGRTDGQHVAGSAGSGSRGPEGDG